MYTIKKNLPSPHIHNNQTNYHNLLTNNNNLNKNIIQPGELISANPSGGINPESLDKDILFFLFTCKATGYLWSIPSNSKTSSAFLEALIIVNNFINTYQFKIKILQTDSENNLKNQIQHITSTPNQHYQNLIERHMQTVIKGISTILHSKSFLREACTYTFLSVKKSITKYKNKKQKTNHPTKYLLKTKQI